ncbi:MAG: DUF1697 domain-containing protein [Dermatophilaceae bacterium]
MPTYIAFLRAINVGKRWVKMEQLRDVLTQAGFRDVATHIQSGNVRVSTAMRSTTKVEASLREVISDAFGFDVPVIVRTPAQVEEIARVAAEFPSPISAQARRYVMVTTGAISTPGALALESWPALTEAARVIGQDVILFLDVPAHETKLTNARVEKLTGAVSTTRDLKVITAIVDKWGASGAG